MTEPPPALTRTQRSALLQARHNAKGVVAIAFAQERGISEGTGLALVKLRLMYRVSPGYFAITDLGRKAIE